MVVMKLTLSQLNYINGSLAPLREACSAPGAKVPECLRALIAQLDRATYNALKRSLRVPSDINSGGNNE